MRMQVRTAAGEKRIHAVFEGGGVRAIAFAGAVCAAEERGFSFVRMAGTSSGAIVASLLAAGYGGDEMKRIILETPFETFLVRSKLHRLRYAGPALRLLLRKGLYSADRLECWIDELLAAKGLATFGDLPPKRLRIIASDISGGRLLVLPDDIARYGLHPQRLRISKAVRMSASIPFFFDPVVLRGPSWEPYYIVDGGLLSNFPLWLLEEESGDGGPPTIGFRLVGRREGEPHRITGPVSMLTALFSTMMDAHDERYIEKPARSRTVRIPTGDVRATQFSIPKEKSLELFEAGRMAAAAFFDKWSV